MSRLIIIIIIIIIITIIIAIKVIINDYYNICSLFYYLFNEVSLVLKRNLNNWDNGCLNEFPTILKVSNLINCFIFGWIVPLNELNRKVNETSVGKL